MGLAVWEGSHLARFRVDGILGAGGMGTVLRAFDPQLQRPVAIKVLNTDARASTEDLTINQRCHPGGDDILAEARALARITPPNVHAVHEIGSERGTTFLVMELIEGSHLGTWLSAGPRALTEIYRVFEQAGRGLAAAHQQNIIHRDFKPENVLIDSEGRVRVCDFGIAAFAGPEGLVRIGEAGTPRYSAPEIWLNGKPSVKSDVYSFAVTLVEAICGQLFTERSDVDRELGRRGVASDVRGVIERALDDDPDHRPGSIDALTNALTRPRPRRRGWIVAGATVGALALGAAAVMIQRDGRDRDERPAAVVDCGSAATLLASRWNEEARAAIRTAFERTSRQDAAADELIARLDRYANTWLAARTSACRATPAQRAAQIRCLDRRLIELGAIVHVVRNPTTIEVAHGRSRALPSIAACERAEAITLPSDPVARANVEDLTRHALALWDRALGLGTGGDQPELERLEREAKQLGDFELAARIQRIRGNLLSNVGKLELAVQAYDASFELATAHALDLPASAALLASAKVVLSFGDMAAAEAKIKIARTLIDRAPEATAADRIEMYRLLTLLALARSQFSEASESLALAERAVNSLDPADPLRAAGVAMQRIWLYQAQGKLSEELALARHLAGELERLGKQGVPQLGNVMTAIIDAENLRGNPGEAIAVAHERVALFERERPADDVQLILYRGDLGRQLLGAGNYVAAIAAYEQAIERARDVPAVAPARSSFRSGLARAHAMAGHLDLARMNAQYAIDEAREAFGERDHNIGAERTHLARIEVAAGELDRAATQLRLAEDNLADLPATDGMRLELMAAQIDTLLVSNQLDKAQRAATEAITLIGARAVEDTRVEGVRLSAARVLARAGRYQEAREPARRALASRRTRRAPADELAPAECEVAKVEYGLGDRAALSDLRKLVSRLRSADRMAYDELIAWFEINRIKR
ncbi:MAG: protein kinase [Kofleriaceae bacterium]